MCADMRSGSRHGINVDGQASTWTAHHVPMSKKRNVTEGLSFKLPLAMKTGVYKIGYKSALKLLQASKTRYIVVASNFPSVKRKLLEYYAVLSQNVPITIFKGSNNELAKVCGHNYRIGVISILDDGEAGLIEAGAQ
ncbi:UNVERIFIED_CONTAM: hypothetical protein PYX00_011361 [Menopon gallinae]|uniref:Ribosomal protein eL8/eL30/eS12/Gadd45 domain-containing protein n=1 Tax=Menopon gallinae TaxID=328185 RepID=A0AAW2H7M2_9NEOP